MGTHVVASKGGDLLTPRTLCPGKYWPGRTPQEEGGAPPPPWASPPPPKTKGTIVGENEIHRWENLVGPFSVHKVLGPRTPPPPSPLPPLLFSDTSLVVPLVKNHVGSRRCLFTDGRRSVCYLN